ncbi:sigma-70 family RNA polymerase sigma factor [Mucilaginibacter corticis]|uniref:Sigma-70 family RNA polymerase sigma factor n=1 Tax=Mucilaginibacter corticis TaxID=2597670 RepID=A0A556M998_9SPHI|nr:sigma-70 family RNA polymerase sigma factor [Mucilaginibacter corticis]TSJ36470.1 sigma-70 family RNA polymerase sigma factor [Mucilaginibacter corticis]
MPNRKLKLPEEILIRAMRERHPNGARALYDMYSTALYGIISRIIPDSALAEDLLQETFIRVWQSVDKYDELKGRLFTWMVNIARNLAIDSLRSKSYRNGLKCHGLENSEFIEHKSTTIEDCLDYRLIRSGVMRLRQEEMQIIDLIYYCGYTHIEAAEALGIPPGTVKTRVTMAVNRLRRYYQKGLAIAS